MLHPLLGYYRRVPEHDDLGSHGGHLVGETVLVDTVHVGSEGVFAV